MIHNIAQALGLVFREEWALTNFFNGLADALSATNLKAFFSAIVMAFEMLAMLLTGAPVSAWGEPIDLTGYEIVFEDEFEAEELDLDVWKYRGMGVRRAGYFSESQVKVEDGNLVMTGEYLENGEFGPGWYASAVSLKEHYLRGYYEIRCKCADSDAFWSAFWLQGVASPYKASTSKGGIESVELDIFEAFDGGNSVSTTIHCAGVNGAPEEDGYQSRILGSFKGNDIYNEYNTYGLLWTEDEYIFYINGVETTRSSFGDGVCINPEEVILSLCVPTADKLENKDTSHKCQFVIDYVRIYQLAE